MIQTGSRPGETVGMPAGDWSATLAGVLEANRDSSETSVEDEIRTGQVQGRQLHLATEVLLASLFGAVERIMAPDSRFRRPQLSRPVYPA